MVQKQKQQQTFPRRLQQQRQQQDPPLVQKRASRPFSVDPTSTFTSALSPLPPLSQRQPPQRPLGKTIGSHHLYHLQTAHGQMYHPRSPILVNIIMMTSTPLTPTPPATEHPFTTLTTTSGKNSPTSSNPSNSNTPSASIRKCTAERLTPSNGRSPPAPQNSWNTLLLDSVSSPTKISTGLNTNPSGTTISPTKRNSSSNLSVMVGQVLEPSSQSRSWLGTSSQRRSSSTCRSTIMSNRRFIDSGCRCLSSKLTILLPVDVRERIMRWTMEARWRILCWTAGISRRAPRSSIATSPSPASSGSLPAPCKKNCTFSYIHIYT
ncbi:hypothetical protein F5H01DRAFT_341468 [Linnemannia elongata]|nr:hypothetical protein F5H01DRAFT_341468 [Linnemannia elongata]